jgi:hypothetical protein
LPAPRRAGLPLIDRGCERLLLDREDHLVLFDQVAVLEQAGPEVAAHPGPYLDLFERVGPADKLGLLGSRTRLGGLHQHGRRRCGLLRARGHGKASHRRRRGEAR